MPITHKYLFMDLIYKLKSCYSLKEAANRVSIKFSQIITIQNLLEFASDGHIELYWNLDHQAAIKISDNGQNQEINFLDGPHIFSVSSNHELPKYCRFMTNLLSDTDKLDQCDYAEIPFDGLNVCDSHGQIWSLKTPIKTDAYENHGITKEEPFFSKKRYMQRLEWPRLTELVFTKEELERFELSFFSAPKTELGNRERQTLLKIIIGMATDGYGYDPNALRSPFPKELEGILDGVGISVSDDTIRKWLKEAAQHLPQNIDGD